MEPSYVVVQVGEMVELRCIVTGYPAPRLVWSYTEGSLPRDAVERDGYLRFRATTRVQGEYRCSATSSIGEDYATVTVVIEEGIVQLTIFLQLVVCLGFWTRKVGPKKQL